MTLLLNPQHGRATSDKRKLDADAWFYEENDGLWVCVSGEQGVHQFIIPKRAILAYADRVEDTQ